MEEKRMKQKKKNFPKCFGRNFEKKKWPHLLTRSISFKYPLDATLKWKTEKKEKKKSG